MLIQLDFPEYEPSLGLRLPVVSGAVIESALSGSEFVISSGLAWTARAGRLDRCESESGCGPAGT